MELCDTHVHLDDEAFAADVALVIQRAQEARVSRLIAIGTTAESSRQSVRLAEQYPGVWAAVGVQPNYCAEANPDARQQIVELSQHPRVVAIGETGLDHHWDFTSLDVQRSWFRWHIELALERKLPFVVHLREGKHGQSEDSCYREIRGLIQETSAGAPLLGIMHSFTGTADQAAAWVALNLHISFAGMVTFRKSDALRRVAATIPAERLLMETDAPYLTPHPFRGRSPNEPAMIVHTAACLAEVRGVSVDELARQTWENACRLFRLSPESGDDARA